MKYYTGWTIQIFSGQKRREKRKVSPFVKSQNANYFTSVEKTTMKMFINISLFSLQIAVAAMLNFPILYTTDCTVTSFMIPIIP